MSEDRIAPQIHETLAKQLFNDTWTLLEKTDRTRDEHDLMVHTAHASRYHWGVIGTPTNLARGEWQCSRAYATLGRAEPALHHAHRSLELCQEHGIGDFDLAFAHEGIARALLAGDDPDGARRQAEEARRMGDHIEDPEDKEWLLTNLAGLFPEV